MDAHWLPVRDSLFAHTNPIYLTVESRRIAEPADADFFIDWITNLEALVRDEGYWPSIIDSVRVFDGFAAANNVIGESDGWFAEVSIFDVRGRLVRRLLHGPVASGARSLYWDGTDERRRRVASGTYFYRFRVGSLSRSAEMLLVR